MKTLILPQFTNKSNQNLSKITFFLMKQSNPLKWKTSEENAEK